jgi:glycosyltransferase involved in cell wall biosynthesis
MVSAAQRFETEATLAIAGPASPVDLPTRMLEADRGGRIRYSEWLDRKEVSEMLSQARVGLAVLEPLENYLGALPTKLFEYMGAGVPVVASDFPLWREIVDGAGCGLLVDPLDPAAIAEAVNWLLRNPTQAEDMGEAGRAAVLDRYSWDTEAVSLMGVYAQLGDRTRNSR